MNSSEIFSSELFWIGLFVLIFACHGYAYWAMTGNIKKEGFREGQHPAPPPSGVEGGKISEADKASIAAAEAAGIAAGGGTHLDAAKRAPIGGRASLAGDAAATVEAAAAEAPTCNSPEEKCREKYLAAYKETGCVGGVSDAVVDWWREKKNDSTVWKNMMSRCQKAAQPELEVGGTLSREELADSQIKCCGAAGCKPKKCTLLSTWPEKCAEPEDPLCGGETGGGGGGGGNIDANGFVETPSTPAPVQDIKDNKEVPEPEVQPRQTPIIPERIPDKPKEEGTPPIQIPGHKHNDHNGEQIKTIEEIRTIMGKMKEIMRSNNKVHKSKLTPEQYKLWQKAVGALKVRKKPKKKPQPISVNVDVTDSRELHYEMPGAPGIVSKPKSATSQVRDLLAKMNISEAVRKEMEDELGRMDGKVEGAPPQGGKKGGMAQKQAEKGQPAKFSELLKKSSSEQYVAYNEDDYGDFKKASQKKNEKK